MDFGSHIYYFACPRPGCGQVYEVLEINLHCGGADSGLLVCPYCGNVIQLRPPVATIRRRLTPEQQRAVRRRASHRLGKIDFCRRLFDH